MSKEVNVDFIGRDGTQGNVAASIMANGLSPARMRPYVSLKDGKTYISVYAGGDKSLKTSYKMIQVNATGTLRKGEWETLDQAIHEVARQRLGGVADLEDKGLVYNLGDGMGSTVLETHNISEALEAELSMDGVSRAQNDRPEYGTVYLPLPIIHADYEINQRVLNASRNMGNALDTTLAERAARRLLEKREAMLFTDIDFGFGGGKVYSYVNYPHRNKINLAKNWSTPATGAEIVEDVRKMKQASIEAYHYGPWMLYIPTAYETILDLDYDTTTPGTTIRERIMKIDGIQGIKVIDKLTANNLLMVQMTSDVVRLVNGMGVQNVQWANEGGLIQKYKVMAIQVPQIRSDFNDKCGIVHMASGLV